MKKITKKQYNKAKKIIKSYEMQNVSEQELLEITEKFKNMFSGYKNWNKRMIRL